MTTPSVWVHLYYKGKDEPEGQPVKVWPRRGDVADLKAVVLPKLEPTELAEIFVYPPGTTPPFSQDKALNSWDQIPSNSSGPQPLIVVAPNPRKQPSGDPGYPFNDSINTESKMLFLCLLLNYTNRPSLSIILPGVYNLMVSLHCIARLITLRKLVRCRRRSGK